VAVGAGNAGGDHGSFFVKLTRRWPARQSLLITGTRSPTRKSCGPGAPQLGNGFLSAQARRWDQDGDRRPPLKMVCAYKPSLGFYQAARSDRIRASCMKCVNRCAPQVRLILDAKHVT